MPLVFAESEVTAAGIAYADRTGISYEYPTRYRRAIQPGERFVYYKGRRKHDGTRAPQVYFGTGIVGAVSDPGKQDRLVCEILDYHPFLTPVPFKDMNGKYLETGAVRRGYFQPGVRTISDEDFERIVAAAEVALEAQEPSTDADGYNAKADWVETNARVQSAPRYASQGTIRVIEDFAVRVAVDELRRRFPRLVTTPMPRNNPGFDVLLGEQPTPVSLGGSYFVEVKGTTRAMPVFFATEGELQFSRRNASRFRLIVVYNIQLAEQSYEIFWHEGAISDGEWISDQSGAMDLRSRWNVAFTQ